MVINSNPYKQKEPILNTALSSFLNDVTYKTSIGIEAHFEPDERLDYSNMTKKIFNNL